MLEDQVHQYCIEVGAASYAANELLSLMAVLPRFMCMYTYIMYKTLEALEEAGLAQIQCLRLVRRGRRDVKVGALVQRQQLVLVRRLDRHACTCVCVLVST